MRRLLTAIVVPFAILTAIAITATAADAGKKPHAVKTKAKITSLSTPPPDHTWVFKGKVTSKNEKCIGGRKVSIYAVKGPSRGSEPPGPTAEGKTKDNGRFVLDTGAVLLLVAPYVAIVEKAQRKDVTCNGTTSREFTLDL